MTYRSKPLQRVLTSKLVLDIPVRVGRKKRWSEDMGARFPEGTFARISAVLEGKEDRTDFVRDAVERELARRELLKPTAKRKVRQVYEVIREDQARIRKVGAHPDPITDAAERAVLGLD